MKRARPPLLALLPFLLLCTRTDGAPPAPHPIWVVGNGFHSGLALRTSDAGPLLRRTVSDPQAKWLVVGWGDRKFFMAKRITPWIASQAVLWPTPSALHVTPLRSAPEAALPHSDLVRIEATDDQVRRLSEYLAGQLEQRGGEPVPLGPGSSSAGAFYAGTESFYFPKMCNQWAARGLKRAGFRISVAEAITANDLVWQSRKLGVQTSRRQKPGDAF